MIDNAQAEDNMTANAQKVNNATGRPTLYTDHMLERAKQYKNGAYEQQNEVIPTLEGLSFYLGINKATVNAWRYDDEHIDFSRIVEDVVNKQAMMLLNGGLSGVYNANITKLILNKHGYSDSQIIETNQNVKIQQQISTNEAARMIDYMLAQAKQVTHDDQTTTIEHKQD